MMTTSNRYTVHFSRTLILDTDSSNVGHGAVRSHIDEHGL